LTFQLASNTLSDNFYITVDFGDWTIDPATSGETICKYRVGGNLYWVPAVFEHVSGNIHKMAVYRNQSTYQMTVGQLVTIRIDHINPDGYHGVLVTDTQWNFLKITAHRADGTVIEHQYAEVWVEPYEHISLSVQTALNYINAVSFYEFEVTPNTTVSAGDFILV
jgi:hypothetical protein